MKYQNTLTLWPYKVHWGTQCLQSVKVVCFYCFFSIPTLGFSCAASGVKTELSWQFMELTAWLGQTKGTSCPKQWVLWSWPHRVYLQCNLCQTSLRSEIFWCKAWTAPYIQHVSLHTFNNLTFMPLISSALHIKLSHTYMLSLACQAGVERSQLEESDFCHKVHLKS